MPKKGENRKKEYDQKKAEEAARIKQFMEQQAMDFEATLRKSGRLALLEFMTAQGLEMLLGFVQEEMIKRGEEFTYDRPKSGLVDAHGKEF